MPLIMSGMNNQRLAQRPRDYATAILGAATREERNEILNRCPEEWRDLVRTQVEANWSKVQAHRKQQADLQAHQRLCASARPPVAGQTKKHFKKAPQEVGSEYLSQIRETLGYQKGA